MILMALMKMASLMVYDNFFTIFFIPEIRNQKILTNSECLWNWFSICLVLRRSVLCIKIGYMGNISLLYISGNYKLPIIREERQKTKSRLELNQYSFKFVRHICPLIWNTVLLGSLYIKCLNITVLSWYEETVVAIAVWNPVYLMMNG